MKIEKIKNKYQVRKMIQGKTYYLFFNNKPTNKDIQLALSKKICEQPKQTTPTLKDILIKYIEIKKNVLSVSTIKGYTYILQSIPNKLLNTKIENITTEILQQLVDEMAHTRTTKTIKNTLGLILATLNYNNIQKHFYITYPKKITPQPYIPTDNDIKKINAELRATKYYTFFRLALYGLRVSEILALTLNDIDFINCTISINKAKVKDIKNQYHIKTTKTITSNRVIKIDTELLGIIKSQNQVLLVNENQFTSKLKILLNKLNIQHFSTHKLRHYMATKLHSLNIPSKYIQAIGGWANDTTLNRVYTHTIDTEQQNYYTMLNTEYIKILN